MIWAPGGKIWIKAIAHHSDSLGFSVLYRNLCNHGLCLCQLIFTAVRHKYTARSDGTVEHLNKTFL